MNYKSLPCTLMRGGTSKGLFFLRSDLPTDESEMEIALLKAFGYGNKRGIDGLGGLDPLANKVAIVSKSLANDIDIDYLFMQISDLENGQVDWSVNCGNILSAVIPYALEKGLVLNYEKVNKIRIRNINTGSIIHASMRTEKGKPIYSGSHSIHGVPGNGAPIELNFFNSIGSKTGAMFPTGSRINEIDGLNYTLIDLTVPLLIFRAIDLGKSGSESAEELSSDKNLISRINEIRIEISKLYGLGDVRKKVYPKIALVAPANMGGSINSRYFVPYTCHSTYAVTGGMSLGVACSLEGTIAYELATSAQKGNPDLFRIEHPAGYMDVFINLSTIDENVIIHRLSTIRTARKLMDGSVYIADELSNN